MKKGNFLTSVAVPVPLLLWLISLFASFFNLFIPYTLQNYAYVNKIIDGDTLEVNYGERVRLAGVQTPERGEARYKEATEDLTEMVWPNYIKIVRFPVKTYGRTVAVLYNVYGQQVNAKMREQFKDKKYDKLLTKDQKAELLKGGWR